MFLPEPWLLHPIAVHFPIALLNVGLLVELWGRLRPNLKHPEFLSVGRLSWTSEAASWLLWLGTASAWAAMGLGLLAEKTAPHVPPAWRTLDHHEDFAYWTVGLFTALSLLRGWLRRIDSPSTPLPVGETLRKGVLPLAWSQPPILAAGGAGVRRGSLCSFLLSERVFLVAWLFACGVLVTTAYFGGRLVYGFGMGVGAPN